jgi:hypothetical protein
MRLLRQRPLRALGEDWVPPRRSGRSTTLGNLDSPFRAAVDPAGLVTLDGAGWSLDWWIGAEDRWHLPCREVAVRQSLVSSSPVVETRLRVPSGDAVHRAYAARDAVGNEVVVVEVENQSKVPFAVALAIRPHGQAEVGRIDEIALAGTTVRIDGQAAIVLPRSPGRMALSDATADCASIVFAGQAAPVHAASVQCPEGLAQGALLFPLAHTATLRVVLPSAGSHDRQGGPEPAALPSAAQVASGWSRQSGEGARIEVPDRRLRDAVLASARHLLLSQGVVDGAAALDLLGFPDEAARTLTAEPQQLARSPRPGRTLDALARHWELTRDLGFAHTVVDLVGALVAAVGRTRDPADRAAGAAALPAVAALLDAAGERRAAADVRRTAVATTGEQRSAEGAELADLLSSAVGTWTWPGDGVGHDPRANALLVTLVRRLLVIESRAGLALLPDVPDSWLGQGVELHDAPTSHGRLSYALRWHGERPALLWQLDPHAGSGAVTITVPRLDPSFATADARGEALLAPVALPDKGPRKGLSLPVHIEPMPRRAT